VNSARLVDLERIGDERGSLVALERANGLPFDIKRVYYIFGTAGGASRGFHAHRDLRQLVISVSGTCRLVVDDGRDRSDIWLNSPTKGLMIEGLIWREMHDFSPDCVLLVLASDIYKESDYIRDYRVFLKECERA
jgi:dTDP-4-dehydrorhamnose 3,5-epimerase-like enzyme